MQILEFEELNELLKQNRGIDFIQNAFIYTSFHWLVAIDDAVVVIYAYSGLLTAALAVTKLELTIDTFEQLAAAKRFKLAVSNGTELLYIIMGSN